MEFFDIPQEYRDCSANNNEEILNLERKNGNHNQNQIQNQILDDLMEIIHEDEKRSEETLCADPDDEYLKKTNWQLNQPILDCSDESDMNQSNFENSQNFNNNFFGTELESPIYVPSLISPNSEFSEELPEEFLNQYLQNTSNNEVLDTGNAWNSNVLQENGKVLYILQPKTEFHQAENNLNNYFENLELTSPTSTISSDIPYFPISDFDTIKSEFSQKMLERPKRNRAKKVEMEKLSRDEKLERRRSNARKNTANYNKRNKEEMDELSKNLEKYQWRLEMRKKTWENTVSNINNSNNFMLNYQPQNPNQNYFPQENIHLIEHQIKIIETEAEKSMRNLENNESIQKLEAHFEYLKQKFEFADNDMELKERNQNTYGSTKSRAKSEMEKSKMMLKLEKIQVELEIYENFKEKIEEIKGFSKSRFMEYIYVKNINLREKFRMGRGDFDKFDQIMAFFELPDPL